MANEGAAPNVEQLRQALAEHEVRYEVWPESLIVEGRPTKVGFELELYGTWNHGSGSTSPGDAESMETFAELRHLADYLVPEPRECVSVDVLPFDFAVHENLQRGLRPEVQLAMRIRHSENTEGKIDQAERDTLKEIEQKLQELGVPRGH